MAFMYIYMFGFASFYPAENAGFSQGGGKSDVDLINTKQDSLMLQIVILKELVEYETESNMVKLQIVDTISKLERLYLK